MRKGHCRLIVLVSSLALLSCSKSSSDTSSSHPGGAAGSGSGSGSGSGGTSSSAGGTGAAGSPFVSTGGANNSGFPDDNGVYVGSVTDVTTQLPQLPPMTNVVARLNDDSTSITFDPVNGALDYRVYALPADADINAKADGSIVIKSGTYRCSGDRETAPPIVDGAASIPSDAIHTLVDNQKVGGFTRKLADATLGYVHPGPGPGLVPVYALGEPDPNADTTCYFARWAASRTKKYTTSEDERKTMLSASARDDGIAFYVPSIASATTAQVYVADDSPGTMSQSRYYMADGPEADARSSKMPAFLVETASGPDLQPLMRVFYSNNCGWSHDELAVGQERFERIYKQGDTLPLWSLTWSGITAPTTLVVEALDSGCPYQGHLSPTSLPSVTAFFGTQPLIHEPYVTVDQARMASTTGEAFINGQHGPAWEWDGNKLTNGQQPASGPAAPLPKAVARAFVNVKPNKHPDMDFYADFSTKTPAETFTDTPCGVAGGNCFATWRQKSATFDQIFIDVESDPKTMAPVIAYGPVLGQLWVTYADTGADTNGKYRLTANQKATMADAKFLHVTMSVDSYSTARRYPQILISDQEAPVQYTLDKGRTIVVQPRGEIGDPIDWPIDYQIEICKLRTWDVNNQCPVYDLHHIPKNGASDTLAPNDEMGEHASADHQVLFDVYASTKRVYLFLDGKPYACADMPADSLPMGPVTVTWGDALYHSAVDHVFKFHAAHMAIDTSRRFDDLGFSSGVAEPSWDESVLPCVAPITL